MVLVPQHDPDSVFGREVAQEDRDDQGVGLVPCHLHEAGGREVAFRIGVRVTEVLHREEVARIPARDPGPVAAPGASLCKLLELLVQPLESMVGQAVNPVVEYAPHGGPKPTGWLAAVVPILERAASRLPATAALECRPRLDRPLRPARTLRGVRSRAMHAARG